MKKIKLISRVAIVFLFVFSIGIYNVQAYEEDEGQSGDSYCIVDSNEELNTQYCRIIAGGDHCVPTGEGTKCRACSD